MALTKPYLYAHAAHVLSLTIQHHNHTIFSYSRSLQQSSNYQSFFLSHSSASPFLSETFPLLHPFLSVPHTHQSTDATMKFFATAAVMALAAGSVVAHAVPRSTPIPEINALSGVGLPTDFSGYTKAPVEIPEVEIPEVEKPEIEIPEVTRRDEDVEVEVGDVEVEVSGLPLAEVSEVVKVTQNVTVIVHQVKALVAEDLAQIRTCLCSSPRSELPR